MDNSKSNSENLNTDIEEVLKLVEVYSMQRSILFAAIYRILDTENLDSNTTKAIVYDTYNNILESGLIMDDGIEKAISKKILESILTNNFVNNILN